MQLWSMFICSRYGHVMPWYFFPPWKTNEYTSLMTLTTKNVVHKVYIQAQMYTYIHSLKAFK